MSDDHELPVFEIPLEGDADPAIVAPEPERPPPNWRRISGFSALAGTVIAIVVATLVLSGGGEDEPTATTVDLDDLSSAITVPPTLTPVTEPPVTLPPAPGDGRAEAPTDLLLVAASVETLPPLTGTTIPQPDTYWLSDESLAALDAPAPRRSITDYVVGVDGFEQTITITNDPVADRYLLEFDSGGEIEPVIVDVAGGLTYVRRYSATSPEAPPTWTTISNDDVVAATGDPDIATFLRKLQLGPIRSDTHDAWALVQANDLVDAGGGDHLREWVVVLDAAAVPEWARYAFGPGAEAAPLPSNTQIGFAVYVAVDGSIRRVTGSAEFGATTQRIVHRIEELDELPVIELPSAAPATLPATEPSVTEPPVTEPSVTEPSVTEPGVTEP